MTRSLRTADRLARLAESARKRHDLTQRQAAAYAGVSRQLVSDIERGKRTEHAFDYVLALAMGLGDLTLIFEAMAAKSGISAAGAAVPATVDASPAARRAYLDREEREANAALADLSLWDTAVTSESRNHAKRTCVEIMQEIGAEWALVVAIAERYQLDLLALMGVRRRRALGVAA